MLIKRLLRETGNNRQQLCHYCSATTSRRPDRNTDYVRKRESVEDQVAYRDTLNRRELLVDSGVDLDVREALDASSTCESLFSKNDILLERFCRTNQSMSKWSSTPESYQSGLSATRSRSRKMRLTGPIGRAKDCIRRRRRSPIDLESKSSTCLTRVSEHIIPQWLEVSMAVALSSSSGTGVADTKGSNSRRTESFANMLAEGSKQRTSVASPSRNLKESL